MFPNSKGNQNITTHCWPDTVYEEGQSLLICRPYRRGIRLKEGINLLNNITLNQRYISQI